MCIYIFAGRFQPFHNGHMQVFTQICEKLTSTDVLVLGVVAPYKSEDVKDEIFLEYTKEHHLPERNPWDVSIPLSAISQVTRSSPYARQIVTTLLPRPEYGWGIITSWFVKERVWVIPSAGEEFDDKKSDYFEKMGDKVLRISDTTGISGRELREYYKNGQYEEFMSKVPKGLADIYFKEKPDDNAENDFQKRAETFERNSKWVTDEKINNIPKNFFQQRNVGDLLDAGGGTGYLSWYLYKNLKDNIKSITLVDLSINMLYEAKNKENYPVQTSNTSIETFCTMVTRKFDTILIRQVLHYVKDLNKVINLLKKVLSDNGIMYVGQILVEDKESQHWHDELMKNISKNRRRSFVYDEFVNCFTQNGFKVIEVQLTDFEEKLTDLYKRRIRTNDQTVNSLISHLKVLTTQSIIEKMSIRFENDNLYYNVKFCHMFLQKIKE